MMIGILKKMNTNYSPAEGGECRGGFINKFIPACRHGNFSLNKRLYGKTLIKCKN